MDKKELIELLKNNGFEKILEAINYDYESMQKLKEQFDKSSSEKNKKSKENYKWLLEESHVEEADEMFDLYESEIESLVEDDKFKLLKQMYINSQYGNCRLNLMLNELNTPKDEIENIKANISFIDGKVKVYRGCSALNNSNEGNSYTLSKEVAQRFAVSDYDDGEVVEKYITIDDILFFNKYYFNGTIEDEVYIKRM